VYELFDLDWTTAGYVTMTKDEDGHAWIEWIDQLHFTFPNTGYGKVPGIRPESGRMSVASGVAWAAEGTTDTDREQVWVGIRSLGGYRVVLEGSRVEHDGANPLTLGAGQPVAWVPAGAFASTSGSTGDLVLSALQTAVAGVVGGSTNEEAHSVVAIGTGLLVTSRAGSRVSLRWIADASRVEPVEPFDTFEGTSDHVVVSEGGPPVLLRVTGDRTRVEAAVVECEGE